MNEFQKRALDLLDELLAAPATKRFTRLLPCPQSDSGAIEKGLRDLPWSEGLLRKPGAKAPDLFQSYAFGSTVFAGCRGIKANFLAIPLGNDCRSKIHTARQRSGLCALYTTAKANIDYLLGLTGQEKNKEQER